MAWGEVGHTVSCEIAYRELTDRARRNIDSLYSAVAEPSEGAIDSNIKTTGNAKLAFIEACVSDIDPASGRALEQFIAVPRSLKTIRTRQCPLTPHCLFTDFVESRDLIRSLLPSDDDLQNAVGILSHAVVQLHQPFSVSFQDDSHGKKVNIVVGDYGCNNLLLLWEECLVEILLHRSTNFASPEALADFLRAETTPEDRAEWLDGIAVTKLATESLQIVRDVNSRYCYGKYGECLPVAGGKVHIDNNYISYNLNVVARQLVKAGLRLGHLLNREFDL